MRSLESSGEVTYTEKMGVNIITNSETFCRKRTGAGRVGRARGWDTPSRHEGMGREWERAWLAKWQLAQS